MKIFLLGASGQLGEEWQWLMTTEKQDGHLLIPYTSSQLDITHFDEVAKEIAEQQPDVIINCAAYTDVDGAEEKRALAKRVNGEAVAHLAKLCEHHKVKLIHYSTDYVFAGSMDDKERFPEGYPETHAPDPINWYGETKWIGEQAIKASGCRYLILRTAWLCGRFGKNFVKTMLRLGTERKDLNVVDDQWGSPSFTSEIVKNSCTLLEQEIEGTYHLTSRGLITWEEFARSIFIFSDVDVAISPVHSEEYPTVARRPNFSKLNTRKVEKITGVTITGWEDGLQQLLEQLKNH